MTMYLKSFAPWLAYALAAGNAVVFKPSEHTPGVGVWLGWLVVVTATRGVGLLVWQAVSTAVPNPTINNIFA